MDIFIGVSVNVMTEDNKIFVYKGKEKIAQEDIVNGIYRPFAVFPLKPWKRGGWRLLTKEKKDE